MSENPLILTWFVPPAPEALLRLFDDAPATAIKSGELLLRETEPYDALYRIDEGVVGQAVINHALAKPVAMNLYVKDTVPGFLNLFSGLPSPRRLIVQQPGAVVRKISKADALERIRKDPELLYLTARWCEAASKSELIGMEAPVSTSNFTYPKILDRIADRMVVQIARKRFLDVAADGARLEIVLMHLEVKRVRDRGFVARIKSRVKGIRRIELASIDVERDAEPREDQISPSGSLHPRKRQFV